jgi:hypothetical protein
MTHISIRSVLGVPYIRCDMSFCIDCAQCVGCDYEMEMQLCIYRLKIYRVSTKDPLSLLIVSSRVDDKVPIDL